MSPRGGSEVPADAFMALVVPEIGLLHAVARSMTGHEADAEDLVQDTLLRACRAIEHFDGRYPRAWLLTILRNANRNRFRKPAPLVVADTDATATAAGARAVVAEDAAAWIDTTFEAEVVAALVALDWPFRVVVELVDLAGLTYAEAAAVLDIPVGTVMSRLHRARARIRSALAATPMAPRR